MRNLVNILVTCATITFLQSCDSTQITDTSRPIESRPQSSRDHGIFARYIAPTLGAATDADGNSANLFSNTGFEDGLTGWNACSPGALSTSNDAHTGSNALALAAEGCFYRSINVQPGEEFELSCYIKLVEQTAWTGMGLGFANSNYEEVSQAPAAVITSADYVKYTTSGTAPATASTLSMWLYSDSGALIDDCQLVSGATESPETPVTPPIQPQGPTEAGDNLLLNGDFSSIDGTNQASNWLAGCAGSAQSTGSALSVMNGACVDQALQPSALTAVANSTATYSCFIAGVDGYADLSVYLDGELQSYKVISSDDVNTRVETTVNAASVSNGFVSLYSEGTLDVQNCMLIADTTETAPNTETETNTDTETTPTTDNNTNTGGTTNTGNTTDTTNIREAMPEGYGGNTTGGAGGAVVYASTGTEINQAMCSRATDDTPLIIMVDGIIDHSNTTRVSGSCDTQDDEIQFKRVSNISLIGVEDRGVLDQIGVHLRETSNIIIQNLHIKNVKKSGSPTSNNGDAIGMESGVSNVWVDHNTLEASGGESAGYDSLIDLKANTKYVTISYNHLRNSSRGGLIGSSDNDDENSFITFHHNWYENIQQRTPLLRHGKIHTYNNYWTNESNTFMYHGINARMGSEALVEGNYFYRSNNPLIASDDSDEPGCWEARDNTIEEINYSRSVGNGALVVPEISNGQLQSTCSVSVPYEYNLDASTDVPAIVRTNVGFGKVGSATINYPSNNTQNVGAVDTDNTASVNTTPAPTEPAAPSTPPSYNTNNASNFEPGDISAACADLISNPNTNWDESSLQGDQEIIECLYTSLGQPVGFGEGTTGGFNPNGGSKLTVITNNKPEDQILAAISSADHHWIVFDKDDFTDPVDLMMYRPFCESSSLASDLGLSESQCRDPFQWCSSNGVSNANCLDQFFNTELNSNSLDVQNYMIDSNTTIDGRGANTTFLFNGFKIGADSSGSSTHQSENVIITNNRFAGVGHVEDHRLDPDMIRSTGESNKIWIHQNTFDNTGDSAFDIKVGAYDISVSFNRLINVKRASLHGSSDSREINSQITSSIHNNLFVTEDNYYNDNDFETLRRVPLMRRGQSHIFNNVFYGYRKDILSVRVGGRVLFDSNMVLNNAEQAAANNNRDDLEYFVTNLLRDYREGGLEVSNSFVWMSDADCQALGAPADLSKSEGTTPDMMAQYSSASRNTINAHLLPAGQDLADYLFTTTGKGGATPWVVSGAPSIATVVANANAGCQ